MRGVRGGGTTATYPPPLDLPYACSLVGRLPGKTPVAAELILARGDSGRLGAPALPARFMELELEAAETDRCFFVEVLTEEASSSLM